jgi:predicted Zn-ribbon and HTH transcriptional regulator
MTRLIFTNTGLADKQEFDRQVASAGRGTVFFKFMISPDPRSEDTNKDLDLPHITRRTIRKLEKAVERRLFFVAAVHNDHTPLRHVHGIFLVRGRLSKEHFRLLQQVAHAEATREATLERKARDLTRANPRYKTLSRIRREVIRGRGGRTPQMQPGCRSCGFGEFTGIPGNRTHCPLCRANLRLDHQPRLKLHPLERRWE